MAYLWRLVASCLVLAQTPTHPPGPALQPHPTNSCPIPPIWPALHLCLPAVSRVQARFNAFVRTFKEAEAGPEEEPKYLQLLTEVRWRWPGMGALALHCRQAAGSAARSGPCTWRLQSLPLSACCAESLSAPQATAETLFP